jgi:hypothetical protein
MMGNSPQAQGASGLSIAGAGLGAYGDILKGQGTAAGDTFKANMLEVNAQRGQVAAVETGADLSTRLTQTIGNIDAMQSAAHTDITSPTAAAVRDTQEQRGLTQKSIAVDQIMAQSQQEEAEAAYLRSAGKTALLSGEIGAGADILGAVGKAVTGLGGPASVVPAGYNPNQLSGLY